MTQSTNSSLQTNDAVALDDQADIAAWMDGEEVFGDLQGDPYSTEQLEKDALGWGETPQAVEGESLAEVSIEDQKLKKELLFDSQLEDNFKLLYGNELASFVAMEVGYNFYITQDPPRLPVDSDELNYPANRDDPNSEFGFTYLVDESVIINGKLHARIKIGKTTTLRSRVMKLRQDFIRNNRLSTNERVPVLFTAPHQNPLKTEKFLHRYFRNWREGTTEFFAISLAEAWAHIYKLDLSGKDPKGLVLKNAMPLRAELREYNERVIEVGLTVTNYDRDPRTFLTALYHDMFLGYSIEHILSKYKMTQKDLNRLTTLPEFDEIQEEHKDLHLPENANRFKMQVAEGQILDEVIRMTAFNNNRAHSAKELLELASIVGDFKKTSIRQKETALKSLGVGRPPMEKNKTIEVLPALYDDDDDDDGDDN
jgi:hypothetical protein